MKSKKFVVKQIYYLLIGTKYFPDDLMLVFQDAQWFRAILEQSSDMTN